MNISLSEEMYAFIKRRMRERYHSSVSEYIRSLVRHDQLANRDATPAFRMPRRANDYLPSSETLNLHNSGFDDDLDDGDNEF